MKPRPLHLPRVLHPGELLTEDFLLPYEISEYRLASAIHVPPRRINEIVHGTRGISADTALRLGIFFGNEAEDWMAMQAFYDLTCIRLRIGDRLLRELDRLRKCA